MWMRRNLWRYTNVAHSLRLVAYGHDNLSRTTHHLTLTSLKFVTLLPHILRKTWPQDSTSRRIRCNAPDSEFSCRTPGKTSNCLPAGRCNLGRLRGPRRASFPPSTLPGHPQPFLNAPKLPLPCGWPGRLPFPRPNQGRNFYTILCCRSNNFCGKPNRNSAGIE